MPVFRTVNPANRTVGTHIFGGNAIPPGLVGVFQVTATASQAVLDNPLTSFDLSAEISDDGVVWRFDAGCSFVGGPNQGKGGTPTVAPGFRIDAREYAGQNVRGVLVVRNQTTRLGMTVESV